MEEIKKALKGKKMKIYGKRVTFLILSFIVLGTTLPITSLKAAENDYDTNNIQVDQIVRDEDEQLISFVNNGDEITYELKISNLPESATGEMKVTDTLETYLEYQTGTTTIDGVVQKDEDVWNNDVLTYEIEGEQSNDEITIKFSAKVKGSNNFDVVFNQANIYGESQHAMTSMTELLYLD